LTDTAERWATMVTDLDAPEVKPARAVRLTVKAKPGRIDWSAMVFDLEALGMSQRHIARECEWEHHSSVNQLKNIPGMQPRFHQGALLLGLWVETTGRNDVPREP
jgi:hypothetical protein